MFVHNRNAAGVLLAVAGAMVLLGFGCTTPERAIPAAENGEGAPTVQGDDTNDADGTDAPIVAWTTYESPTLGLRVPYPEGWNFREDRGEEVTAVFIDAAPLPSSGTGSDAPVRVTVTATQISLDDALAAYSTASDTTTVNFGSRRVTKVAYRSEIGISDENPAYREAYHWEVNGYLYTVDGARGDAVVEYVASTLASQEE